MPTPTLAVNEQGLITIDWPDPRPESFAISSDMFSRLIGEANLGRLRLRAITELHTALTKMIEPTASAATNGAPEILTELPT